MTLAPLKRLADIRISNVDKKSADSELPVRLCNYTDVYYRDRIRADQDFMVATASAEQVSRFRLKAGDILVTKDSETADDIAIPAYVDDSAPDLVCGYHLAIVRPHPGVHSRYLFWAIASDHVRRQMEVQATGVTRFGLRQEALGGATLHAPEFARQRAIADFLDAETAWIEALIEKKRRLIELLEERLWAAVSEAILAQTLEFAPLRRFLVGLSDGPFGSSLTSGHYSESGARVVRLGNIGFASFLDDDQAFIPTEYYRTLQRHRVRPGDLLIAGLGDALHHVGRACVAPDLGDAIVKADCYCAKVDRRRSTPEFLAYFLSSPLGNSHVALTTRGTTRSRINLDIARDIPVPLLSLESQGSIVDMARELREDCRQAGALLRRQVDLLAEHRQALITVAVTGELEVQVAA